MSFSLPSIPRRRMARVAASLAFALAWLVFPSIGHGTIEEQRARLPPAAECDDEIVAGIWRAHRYSEEYGDWQIFTLTIRRMPDEPNRLVGTITNHDWLGTADQEEPPECTNHSGWDWIVSMDGVGEVTGENSIYFRGVGRWRLDQVICHSGPAGYNLDNFSGVIDPSILEFQSENNDGGRDVHQPYVFRRIRCLPPEAAHSPETQSRPPSFYPRRFGGCNIARH